MALPGLVLAQGVDGTIEGKVTDDQGLALRGATIIATNTSTGFQRSTVSEGSGVFGIPGLPVGSYDVKASLAGFLPRARKGVIVHVAATTPSDLRMTLATRSEAVTVVAEAPLIDPKESGVSQVVTQVQIANLPLNGRQFGNLAALVPGVGLGFHPDPTKSTQFAPQVGGGSGRNINYVIDGGDNDDDTVGGLVQNFPLDSIAEFNFTTQRFRAEYGRAYGGVLNVATKSGTNEFAGSAFEYFRDEGLNAQTQTEKLSGVPKSPYRKHQFGGSLGGPIVKDRTHFFVSMERIQQDTKQSVDTQGLFPGKDGVFPVPYRENMAVAKLNHSLSTSTYLTVRYGFDDNSQPYGAGPTSPPENWGDNRNTFHSANANLNSLLATGRLNEFVFQYSYFRNHISANSTLPSESFPNGVTVGQNIFTPQATEQQKWQFRDDFTWTMGRHQLKAGASFIHEPVLDVTGISTTVSYTHLTDEVDGPIGNISQGGLVGEGSDTATIPNNQYGVYVQDAWRVTDRLILDLGLRYDLVTGFAFDQSANPVFQDLQAAARAGLFKRDGFPCPCVGFEDFGLESKEDGNNVAPRAGFTYDVKGDGGFVVRGGVGRYYDFAYTNANILFAVAAAQVPFGEVYSYSDTSGIRNADGGLYHPGEPLPPNQLGEVARPHTNHAASPRVKQPYTDQVNLGFSKALGKDLALELDAVYSEGKDLGLSPRLNVRIDGGARRFSAFLTTPNVKTANFAVDVSRGRSHYEAVTLALKKRWDGKLQFTSSYTLSKSAGTAASGTDGFGGVVYDAFDPFGPRQEGPVAVDARHRLTVSGVWSPGWGITIAPIFRYRSRTPYTVITGTDDNRDGVNSDLPAGAPHRNQARGADFKQLDVRLSKTFGLPGRAHLELIGEAFNVTNAKNPDAFVGNMRSSSFGQPTAYAGDFQRSEQRLFQLGARVQF